MVRLAPGRGSAPDEVRFTEEEKTAVVRTASLCGYVHLSTFIREVGVDAAMVTVSREGLDDYQLVKSAALECNLHLGEWFRLVVLAAVGHTPLPSHMKAGTDFVQRLDP